MFLYVLCTISEYVCHGLEGTGRSGLEKDLMARDIAVSHLVACVATVSSVLIR